MAQDSTGPKGQPQFSDLGAPDMAVDPGLVADYAAKVGNRRTGTTAERLALADVDFWEGLAFGDTTLKAEYKVIDGVWKAILGDTGFISATLLNGWVAFGTPTSTPSHSKLNGVVSLDGALKNGTVGNSETFKAFTLPVGSRPAGRKSYVFPTVEGGTGRIDVYSSGNVVVATGTNTFVPLDQVSFRVL